MLTLELSRYINPTMAESSLPKTPEELYGLLDSGNLTRDEIGAVVRNRYPETAQMLDTRLRLASDHEYKDLVGLIGAFNYVRGMSVIKLDGSIDRDVAPRIMLSPSAAIQTLDVAGVTKEDRVLELFTGGGYFSLFLDIRQPTVLDSVDLYTPGLYSLNRTLVNAYDWIYGDLPNGLKPASTFPNFIQADCSNLPDLSRDFRFHPPYNKVFLHPPYGRESKRLIDITEQEAFNLWVDSLKSVHQRNQAPFTIYSVIPTEWVQKLEDFFTTEETMKVLQACETRLLKETRMFSLSMFVTRA